MGTHMAINIKKALFYRGKIPYRVAGLVTLVDSSLREVECVAKCCSATWQVDPLSHAAWPGLTAIFIFFLMA